jgi:hypothetical protein
MNKTHCGCAVDQAWDPFVLDNRFRNHVSHSPSVM